MMDIKVIFPDQSQQTQPAGVSVAEAIGSWKKEALATAVAASVNGASVDLNFALAEDAKVEPIDIASKKGLSVLRHSISHVMAQAVQDVFPGAKVTIGPSIEDGFYYDFEYAETFTVDDFEKIEKRMKEIVAADYPFVREELPREKAVDLFAGKGEDYKVELIRDLPADVSVVSLYKDGDYVDLCRGPHIPRTGMIKAFKLLSVAGAYWRGDERNKMLQRIYGTGFADEQALQDYLTLLEEAKKRDHRRLGKELDLFQVNDEAGAGLVIFHPKGMLLRYIIEEWERKEHLKRGYDMVMGPQILKVDLWKKSGHFDHYRDNMYFTEVDEQTYGIKPMNCLAHMLIYKSKIRSYRDLPLRYFELGTVHRHEKTGVLHGLMRVRQFTQDDAHILCMPEQLNAEIRAIADFVSYAMGIFGFEYEVELSTRPEHSIGSEADWDLATRALENALTDNRIPYEVNEGDGAFYGPKIDFKLKDALKRKWQCATIQCDFTLPERFDLSYIGPDGEKHRPVMLHRVILGAIERFMGVLIEHYAGAFPVWLAPVQCVVLTVTDKQIPYARKVVDQLTGAGVRCEAYFDNDKLGYKIRQAQMQKIPYMLVIGDKEVAAGTVAPRARDGRNLGALPVEEFIVLMQNACEQKK
ncbi:MAG TPA: threonine--tRNA ligase [Smithellaceae bacterium]|jgi:threonyl-tRNA synthetase|nr:threonine--tRNA ligase [Smithellaceae bacterium]HOE23403.1 threonine--tRNA ligase [Smithellaceae bacterium]HOU55592.1 threonine--tRNA ligase [Smithellaceae bacterium]HPL32056.1 threonine--tRNA ligase [Smithellaceae bacterium]HPO22429.1 threonine--tRNA ligase [Smithellaceae bacterium]